MSKRSFQKSVVISTLIILIIVLWVAVFFTMNNNKQKTAGNTSTIKEARSTDALDDALLKQTQLGVDNLTSKSKRESLEKVFGKIGKEHYAGAYLATNNASVVFSGQHGYANTEMDTNFKVNSSFVIGNYQDIINDALLLKMAQNGDLKTSDTISKYITSATGLGKMTIHSLLVGDSKLYLKKNTAKKLVNDNSVYKSNLNLYHSDQSNRLSANALVKMLILEKVSGERYKTFIKHELEQNLNLSDVRFYQENSIVQANDVKGYKYKTKNRIPVQHDVISYRATNYGNSQLRLSLSDIVSINHQFFGNKYFSKKYNSIFYDSVKNVTGSTISNQQFNYYNNSAGQYLAIKMTNDGKKITVVAANFPNKGLTNQSLVKKLYSLY